jgi:hypothetical protein
MLKRHLNLFCIGPACVDRVLEVHASRIDRAISLFCAAFRLIGDVQGGAAQLEIRPTSRARYLHSVDTERVREVRGSAGHCDESGSRSSSSVAGNQDWPDANDGHLSVEFSPSDNSPIQEQPGCRAITPAEAETRESPSRDRVAGEAAQFRDRSSAKDGAFHVASLPVYVWAL